MNTQEQISNIDAAMRGRRILAVLPPSGKDRTKFIVSILAAAKERWGCEIGVVCQYRDQKSFRRLVGPSGRTFAPPPLLKIDDWERDPDVVAEVEKRMREMERVTGVPTGRILLAGSHGVGRAFTAPVRFPPRYQIIRRVLEDNMEPFRIVRRLFKFADEMIEDFQPDLICGYELATPANFLTRLAAGRHNIPSVAIRHSKIVSDYMFWTADDIMLNSIAVENAVARLRAKSPVSDFARSHIEKFRNTPKVVGYIASKWRHRTRQNFFRWHLSYARVVLRELLSTFSEPDKSLREPAFGRLFRYYRSLYLTYRQSFLVKTFDDETLAKMKFVYFPLHKESEIAQMYQATLWHNQINTVRVLASVLPMGYRLLVREHRLNNGQRPTRYFKELEKIPNVTLIDAIDSQFKYLRNAALVVTENGSSGWEGLLLKKPVLLLSRTFYDGAGLGTKVRDPDELNAAVLRALDQSEPEDAVAYDHALGCMIDGELETIFPVRAEGVPMALDRLRETVGSILPRRAEIGVSR